MTVTTRQGSFTRLKYGAAKGTADSMLSRRIWSVTIISLLGPFFSHVAGAERWGRSPFVRPLSLNISPQSRDLGISSAEHLQYLNAHHHIGSSMHTKRDHLAPRCGGQGGLGAVEKTAAKIVGILTTCVTTCLPPIVAIVRAVVAVYRVLPTDAIIAQVGLVYCFAGGYYPALFAALQAAQQCGWKQMIRAIQDLSEEALNAVAAMERTAKKAEQNAREIFTEATKVVLATVNPVKINQAVAALYTTWMGVSQVLSKEFAKTITLSLTLGNQLQPILNIAIGTPVYMVVPKEYHLWVPVVIGWTSKAIAMSIAWRIQRVLTASTSAMLGGLMFSQALMRMFSHRSIQVFDIPKNDQEKVTAFFEEFIGLVVGGFGLYTQLSTGFSLKMPFPLNVLTWPFEWAENWIQWKITEAKVS